MFGWHVYMVHTAGMSQWSIPGLQGEVWDREITVRREPLVSASPSPCMPLVLGAQELFSREQRFVSSISRADPFLISKRLDDI